MSGDVQIVPAGDSMLLVRFDGGIDPATNARAIGVAARLRQSAVPGVRDIVPSYRAVAIYFDPVRTDRPQFERALDEAIVDRPGPPAAVGRLKRVPVCYGDEFGPDLEDVARFGGVSPDEVVAIHSASIYRVYMLGFMPGFAYMGVVDDRIAAPRLAVPRARVDAGSVGIAGRQTGVYPSQTPGGWRIIGRTPVRPFDQDREHPFFFTAGDEVQFYPVTRSEFAELQR